MRRNHLIKHCRSFLGLCAIALTTASATAVSTNALAQTITSPSTQVDLLEVYTSQGCSSCPPAEHWLTKFEDDPRLWKEFIPMNFHVDYWDYLGWKDPFASSRHTTRQRTFKQLGLSRTIATPGFIFNGKGWNGWFYKQQIPLQNKPASGVITASIENTNVSIQFDSKDQLTYPLKVNVAVLGFNLATLIKRGENRGKELVHDFVVLDHIQTPMIVKNTNAIADLTLPDVAQFKSSKEAIVVWVSKTTDPTPIQAAGDWIKQDI